MSSACRPGWRLHHHVSPGVFIQRIHLLDSVEGVYSSSTENTDERWAGGMGGSFPPALALTLAGLLPLDGRPGFGKNRDESGFGSPSTSTPAPLTRSSMSRWNGTPQS